MFAHNFVSKSDYLTKNIIQVMFYYFHSILHVTEFPDTLSYVARTMSDKRSFEQLFCHLLKVLCIQETFASSLSLSTPTFHLLIFSFLLVSPIIFLPYSQLRVLTNGRQPAGDQIQDSFTWNKISILIPKSGKDQNMICAVNKYRIKENDKLCWLNFEEKKLAFIKKGYRMKMMNIFEISLLYFLLLTFHHHVQPFSISDPLNWP